jgi:transcriptional regulator with XRE-family HTH domain
VSRQVSGAGVSGELLAAYRADRVVALREKLHLSQPVFAAALNVSPETIKKWEQGKREPDGAALRLLELAEQHPEWILERLSSFGARSRMQRRLVKSKAARSAKR